MSRILSTTAAARRCGVSRRTLTRWIDAGVLPAIFTTGGHRRVKEQDLLDFLDARRSLRARDRAAPALRVAVLSELSGTAHRVAGMAATAGQTVDVVEVAADFAGGLSVAAHRPHLILVDSTVAEGAEAALVESSLTSHALIRRLPAPLAQHAVRAALRDAEQARNGPV